MMQSRSNTINGTIETIDLIDITTATEHPMTKKDVIERIYYLSVLATKSTGSAHAAHKNMIAYYENSLKEFEVPDLYDLDF